MRAPPLLYYARRRRWRSFAPAAGNGIKTTAPREPGLLPSLLPLPCFSVSPPPTSPLCVHRGQRRREAAVPPLSPLPVCASSRGRARRRQAVRWWCPFAPLRRLCSSSPHLGLPMRVGIERNGAALRRRDFFALCPYCSFRVRVLWGRGCLFLFLLLFLCTEIN